MNCIWIVTDSFRQDHVHCYRPEGTLDEGGESIHVQTPNLDALSRRGVLFERMRSEALPTIPCRRGIHTGRRIFPWKDEPFPKGLVVRTPGWRPLREDDVTLAEHLSEQGYATAMFADTYHLMKPAMNFHRGFQGFHWERGQECDQWKTRPLPDGMLQEYMKPDRPIDAYRTHVLRQYLQNHLDIAREEDFPCPRTFRSAIEWLQQNHTHERFFLYIDTFSPHEPWLAPDRYLDIYDPDYRGASLIYGNPYRRRELTDAEHHHLRASYAAVCTMVDHWIGELIRTMDGLGLAEKTLVVLMSDHGKIIGEFDCYGMSPHCTGPALSPVPCFIVHPDGQNAGRRFGGWLYNIDLTATVLALLDVEPKQDVEGTDVWPAVSDGAGTFRPHLVTAHRNWVAAWQDDWLYLLDAERGGAALYNLADDIHRQHDVADRYASTRDALARTVTELVDA